MTSPSSRSCEACDRPVSLLTGVRRRGRGFCGHACAASARAARLKADLDAQDPSPTVCRCAGAPMPLEPTGPHCSQCRRMFSAEMRLWLTRKARHRPTRANAIARWMDELAWQLGLRSTGMSRARKLDAR